MTKAKTILLKSATGDVQEISVSKTPEANGEFRHECKIGPQTLVFMHKPALNTPPLLLDFARAMLVNLERGNLVTIDRLYDAADKSPSIEKNFYNQIRLGLYLAKCIKEQVRFHAQDNDQAHDLYKQAKGLFRKATGILAAAKSLEFKLRSDYHIFKTHATNAHFSNNLTHLIMLTVMMGVSSIHQMNYTASAQSGDVRAAKALSVCSAELGSIKTVLKDCHQNLATELKKFHEKNETNKKRKKEIAKENKPKNTLKKEVDAPIVQTAKRLKR